jgi:hypothetical protein
MTDISEDVQFSFGSQLAASQSNKTYRALPISYATVINFSPMHSEYGDPAG